MQNKIARGSLIGSFLLLALAGCSGGADVGQGPQSGGTSTEAVQADVTRAHHDPAAFVKRFDENGDGVLELAELPDGMGQWIGKADTDGDGKLTVAELTAHREAMHEAMFEKADKNGDGALDPSEVDPERWEHLKVADADGNGSVTRAEIQKAHESGLLREGFEHGHARGKWLAHLDKNGDGIVEPSEVPDRMRPKLEQADANHDGKVTVDELRADFAAHRGEHRFAHLDKNGDGVVTQDECDARVWEHVSRADANADGRVTEQELEQARARRVEAR